MEKLEEVFAQYDIERKRIFRGRKMLMCEDEQGHLYGVMEVNATEYRLLKEYLVKQYLIKRNFKNVDQLVKNKEQQFITEDRYHTSFLLKEYFMGRECDANSVEEVREGAANLARFHTASAHIGTWMYEQEKEYREQYKQNLEKEGKELEPFLMERSPVLHNEEQVDGYAFLEQLFSKRNRELKRICSYMRKPGRKGEFVTAYNDCAPQFLEEAKESTDMLYKVMETEKEKEKMDYGLCHGSYQHHNILRLSNGWATVGLENFHFGIQLEDLYDFLRKILEKNNYEFLFAQSVVNGYNSIKSLTKTDYRYLYMMLCYPDKFWKISNRYFNAKKTWVPPKTVEKLSNVVKQNEEKHKFLVKFKEDYVD